MLIVSAESLSMFGQIALLNIADDNGGWQCRHWEDRVKSQCDHFIVVSFEMYLISVLYDHKTLTDQNLTGRKDSELLTLRRHLLYSFTHFDFLIDVSAFLMPVISCTIIGLLSWIIGLGTCSSQCDRSDLLRLYRNQMNTFAAAWLLR